MKPKTDVTVEECIDKAKSLLSKSFKDPSGCIYMRENPRTDIYPSTKVKLRGFRISRLMLTMKIGRIPEEWEFACHHCDNKPCINPDHLFLGDHSDNMIDYSDKGLHANSKKTHCVKGHPLDKTIIRTETGREKRYCSVCYKETKLRYHVKVRLNKLRNENKELSDENKKLKGMLDERAKHEEIYEHQYQKGISQGIKIQLAKQESAVDGLVKSLDQALRQWESYMQFDPWEEEDDNLEARAFKDCWNILKAYEESKLK